ncbi:MAG: sigma-70 family RNA polymerase sigma factor [Leptospiraceae bacterium]|nr:sigma-70 family RNA polymerase sigma factor [Leptospiraceae bacterium]MCB1321283.1 sigma-70 family RNA polymerase sigma factor [Leptospiraceae bacterium]
METDQKRATERALIERIKAGDGDAYMELVGEYRIRLYRKACSIINDAEDAEDVLQDALLTAYRALPRFRGESGIYTWLYRIVVNKCRDYLRSSRNTRQESMDPTQAVISDDRISVEKNLELSDDAGYLMTKINGLDDKYRQILVYRYYDELSYEEIAELIHVNIGTVKSRLFKARELLKRSILRNGRGEEYFTF